MIFHLILFLFYILPFHNGLKISNTNYNPLRISKLRLIPQEISSIDSIKSIASLDPQILLPNTAIKQLDGGSNLGAILWTYVLFNGFFPFSKTPADAMLSLLANVTGAEKNKEKWFLDFQEGFEFFCPPTIELTRLSIFMGLGWYANNLWISILDGDVFWGWSTAMCLCIPTVLITASRGKRITRQQAELESMLKEAFKEFRNTRLIRTRGRRCSEVVIETAFKRSTRGAFRTKLSDPELDQIKDKLLRRILRSWVGYKPNEEGDFVNLELLPPPPTSSCPPISSSLASEPPS